jgi:hypothetical protein
VPGIFPVSRHSSTSQDHAIATQGFSPETHNRRFRFFPSSRWATSPLSGAVVTLLAAVTSLVWGPHRCLVALPVPSAFVTVRPSANPMHNCIRRKGFTAV